MHWTSLSFGVHDRMRKLRTVTSVTLVTQTFTFSLQNGPFPTSSAELFCEFKSIMPVQKIASRADFDTLLKSDKLVTESPIYIYFAHSCNRSLSTFLPLGVGK
jgi:hypothetical protein